MQDRLDKNNLSRPGFSSPYLNFDPAILQSVNPLFNTNQTTPVTFKTL
jgi:hypothetical protein